MKCPEHFDPRQDGRSNLQIGALLCLCADVEQEVLLFWRGDVEAGIMNGDGFRAVTSPHTSELLRVNPLMPKKKDTVTTLDMGPRKVTVVFSLQSDSRYCK